MKKAALAGLALACAVGWASGAEAAVLSDVHVTQTTEGDGQTLFSLYVEDNLISEHEFDPNKDVLPYSYQQEICGLTRYCFPITVSSYYQFILLEGVFDNDTIIAIYRSAFSTVLPDTSIADSFIIYVSYPPEISTVPLPASLPLFATALLGLAAFGYACHVSHRLSKPDAMR